ncbi:MAG: hypothetical protein ACXVUE_24010 [Solirubrobacteraceae bacterium]
MTLIADTNTAQPLAGQASPATIGNSSTNVPPLAYHTGLLIR